MNSEIWRKQVKDKVRQRYAKQSVSSLSYDSGSTSRCGMNNNEFILTDKQSNKLFHIPTGTTAQANCKSQDTL